ncbi:sugar nucleotide-binding protein [Rhodoferax aquaticus]|uniref:NAD-dependent epimerase/dehydratase family protein n=1 Tax=Rhodoferax aquaticus TaxID=2527691 RepID=A0A515EK56_9BURK|nr:sugar nucleotide-binding protein [Rhodoferax aquaticus]QDL53036.1 NAD-dependent epimerase/dehydratase family protein [Rhodoferax aquaticus]
MSSTVLVLGARGRLGWASCQAFAQAGWQVIALTRGGATEQVHPAAAGPHDARIRWVSADLFDTREITQLARGASVVVHAINPLYTNKVWQTQALPMLDASIELARALGATLMLPGNVYNFGTGMPPVLTEQTAQNADTVKGAVRVTMEQRLQASGVRSVVIRAGDFFGSGTGSWFDSALAKDLRQGQWTYLGASNIATPWAYLPDLARTFVAVAAKRENLPMFSQLHFAGYSVTDQAWADALAAVAHAKGWLAPGARLKQKALPWPIIRMGAWFNPVWAALLEMRYLWQTPHRLDNQALCALIGTEPHTPFNEAVRLAAADLHAVAG